MKASRTVRGARAALAAFGCLVALAPIAAWAQGSQATAPTAARADFLATIERPRTPLAPTPVRTTVENGFVQERLSFESEPGERVPVLLVKKAGSAGRRAVVIALHGTGGSKEGMRTQLQSYAEQGFVAVSMDARHHGERAAPISGLANPYESAMLRAFRTGKGHPYLYDTVWDVMRLIDYLATRADVDAGRIGLIGLSKGGTEAYLAAAADDRIAAVVPLIGVQSYRWSLQHPSGWEARTWSFHGAVQAAAADSNAAINAAFMRKFYDRIAPGLVDRFDGPAMLPLIAPRPLLVVSADSDPRSPLAGVREAAAAARLAYSAAGAAERFSFLLEENAAHEVTPEANRAALEWLVRWLAPSRD